MPDFVPLSVTEQVQNYLRGEILDGRWKETIPGKHTLASEMGVNNKTIETALIQLEQEGVLVSQGRGKSRKIAAPKLLPKNSVRVALIPFGDGVRLSDSLLHRALARTENTLLTVNESVLGLGTNTKKMEKLVKETGADAWVISSGTRELLSWFSARPQSSFALFGQRGGLAMPSVGPDMDAALGDVTRHLLDLGHRRIVMLRRTLSSNLEITPYERIVTEEIASRGLPVGDFNIPRWGNTYEGFHSLLKALFSHTPPTALIAEEPVLYNAVQHYCSKHGLRVPEDISLVCTDIDPSFDWCQPSVAHLRWEPTSVVDRLVQWLSNVNRGVADLDQTLTSAEYVRGGTVTRVARS